MRKIIEAKGHYSDISPKELYKLLFENFRVSELKFILKRMDYTQKEFLTRMGYTTYTAIARMQELDKLQLSSEKPSISSKWVEFLRNEIGDELLLILRELFLESNDYRKMVKNDSIIDEKLKQGRKFDDEYSNL